MHNEKLSYEFKDVKLDVKSRKVTFQDKEISLTTTEYDLLLLLVKNGGSVVTKDEILDEVWGYDSEVSTNVVEVYIRYLRNKMEGIQIDTIRGVGYRLS